MRLTALQTCVALLAAFVVAPFQHVHPGGSGAGHEHSAIVHAHFYSVHSSSPQPSEPHIADADDDHDAVWSVDTFTLVLTAGLAPFVPIRGRILALVVPEVVAPVEVVEERGHDPPCVDRSIPRAPPS